MSTIKDYLNKIKTAIYGREVRQSIVDSIEQCYKDATGHPESVIAVVNEIENVKQEQAELSSQIDENTKYLENRIDNIVVESGDNPIQIQDSLIDVTNKNHDTLNQRLNSDTDFILGLNKNIIKLNYNSNGEVIKIEEINDNNETISTTNIEYKDGIVSKVTDKIGINTTITTFNFDNNNQLEKIIRS